MVTQYSNGSALRMLFFVDQNIVKQLNLVKSKLKTYNDQEKKMCTNMFSS